MDSRRLCHDFRGPYRPMASRLPWAVVVCLCSLTWGQEPRQNIEIRQPGTAEKVINPQLPNLYRVDENLYRGAQPETAGYRELRALGIRTVVNLRLTGSEEQAVLREGLRYMRVPMAPWAPNDRQVTGWLRIVTNPDNAPVFIHCRRGADRTGMFCAVYRVVVLGWSKEQAIREMTQGGFGFDPMWQSLIRYVENLDVEEMRRQVGLAVPSR